MNIHQLSVLFDERQDRLLLRVNTQEGEEVRLWLTRRIGLKLAAPLQQTVTKLESSNAAVLLPDAQAQAMLVELKQEDFLQKADFSTPFSATAQTLPLGPVPMLVTEITLTVLGSSEAQIVFKDAGDAQTPPRACTLQMQVQLIHGLLHLLKNAVKNAQWHDAVQGPTPPLTLPPDTDDNAPVLGRSKRSYRH